MKCTISSSAVKLVSSIKTAIGKTRFSSFWIYGQMPFAVCPICMKQIKRLHKILADMHYDINEMEDSQKFISLLKQKNNNFIHWIGNYIYSAMKTGKKVSEDTM